MPNFSNGRALPSSRQEKDRNARCRGRRPGNASTCRARLRGWVANVAKRSPIWGDVDLEAFSRTTGYSREHATRELSTIRRESRFVFETKLRSKRGSKSRRWGVMVADPVKLRYDKHSLFYDSKGSRLHNYTTLANGGEKIAPTALWPEAKRRQRGRPIRSVAHDVPKRPRGRPRKQGTSTLPIVPDATERSLVAPTPAQVCVSARVPNIIRETPRPCDNPLKEDSYGIQQKDLYGAARDVTLCREGKERKSKSPALKRKAFSLQGRLESSHWDNCKVEFSNRAAHCYALQALTDGHEEDRIISSYEQALFVRHGYAVDRAASSGKIIFFNASSTIVKAAELLAKDGLDRRERMARWYSSQASSKVSPCFDPAELAAIRAQIAATFPRAD